MSHQKPFVLSIDIGSSTVKCGIYDADAKPLHHTFVAIPHEQRVAIDGTHEEDPLEILTTVESAVDATLSMDLNASNEIAAVGMDTMASTIMGLDADLNPVTPVYTYADTRSGAEVDLLREQIDVDAAYDRTGVMQHTSYVPGKVLWLKRTDPETYRRVAMWCDVSTFIFQRWLITPEMRCSYSVAAWSGLLDRRKLCWDSELLSKTSLKEEMLPRLTPYHDLQVGLDDLYGKRWRQLADVPFTLAVGDGAAANVGSGCVDTRNVALTVGTTAAMRLVVEDEAIHGPPPVPRGLWGYRLDSTLTLLGGAFSEGGNVVEWARRNLRIPDLDILDEALKRSKPDGHGLTVLPFIAGERAVGWSNNASGVLAGVNVSTSGLDMAQALMESVAYRFSLVRDLLAEHLDYDYVFVAGGGASTHSSWWMQTMSDVLQSEVQVPQTGEATSRGAAILALHAIGIWEGLDDVPPDSGKIYEPREELSEIYMSARERQMKLYSEVIE